MRNSCQAQHRGLLVAAQAVLNTVKSCLQWGGWRLWDGHAKWVSGTGRVQGAETQANFPTKNASRATVFDMQTKSLGRHQGYTQTAKHNAYNKSRVFTMRL